MQVILMHDAEELRRKLKRSDQINHRKQPRLSYLIWITFLQDNALGESRIPPMLFETEDRLSGSFL